MTTNRSCVTFIITVFELKVFVMNHDFLADVYTKNYY